MLVLSELWEEPEGDLDWDKLVIRKLIESICAAAVMPLQSPAVTEIEEDAR
jgi:hypothetical protein